MARSHLVTYGQRTTTTRNMDCGARGGGKYTVATMWRWQIFLRRCRAAVRQIIYIEGFLVKRTDANSVDVARRLKINLLAQNMADDHDQHVYYRLNDHDVFLENFGVEQVLEGEMQIEPREIEAASGETVREESNSNGLIPLKNIDNIWNKFDIFETDMFVEQEYTVINPNLLRRASFDGKSSSINYQSTSQDEQKEIQCDELSLTTAEKVTELDPQRESSPKEATADTENKENSKNESNQGELATREFICDNCGNGYKHNKNLLRHKRKKCSINVQETSQDEQKEIQGDELSLTADGEAAGHDPQSAFSSEEATADTENEENSINELNQIEPPTKKPRTKSKQRCKFTIQYHSVLNDSWSIFWRSLRWRCLRRINSILRDVLHQKTVHEGRKDFTCDKCDKKFGDKNQLKRHQTSVYEARRDYICDKCEKKFGNRGNLNKDQKTVHEGRKDYPCDKYEKKFVQKQNLLIHQKIVHEGRRDFVCDKREKKFGHKQHLLYHQRKVHEGRQDLTCDKCERKFGYKGHLLLHIKTVHENLKEYACDKCEKKFGRKADFIRHQNAVHQDQIKFTNKRFLNFRKKLSSMRSVRRSLKEQNNTRRSTELKSERRSATSGWLRNSVTTTSPAKLGWLLSFEFVDSTPSSTEPPTPVDEKDSISDTSEVWKPSTDQNISPSEDAEIKSNYSVDSSEGRSLPNVLKRISNIVAHKSNNLQSYNDSQLRSYWMPDNVSKQCYECGERFTTFRRRHHCRICGQIFCSKCCSDEVPGKIMGVTDSDGETKQPLQAVSRLPSSGSSFYLDLDLEASTVSLKRPTSNEILDFSGSDSHSEIIEHKEVNVQCQENSNVPEDLLNDTLLVQEKKGTGGWNEISNLKSSYGEASSYQSITSAYKQHEDTLIRQLLNKEGLSQSWSEIILRIAHQVVEHVRPDLHHDADDMDIRQYIQIKKSPGGNRKDCEIVSGIVCSKNVSHKSMNAMIANPKILLLRCGITYQRVEGKLLSLEPILMQESQFLQHTVARINSLRPDIVLVHKSVSRLAQDKLRKSGVTLVLNVKLSILERLARCTGANIVDTIDAHISTRSRLGMCKKFYLRNFPAENTMKTLMFFEGCANPHLGGTVLLRGGSAIELKKVKKVTSMIIFSAYSYLLEKSFLMDEFARPPSPKDNSFLDDSSRNSSPSKSKKRNQTPKSIAASEPSLPEGLQLDVNLLPAHSFVTSRLTKSSGSQEIRDQLAHFRACGGRLPKVVGQEAEERAEKLRASLVLEQQQPEQAAASLQAAWPDCLDSASHQRLSVLFCSFLRNTSTNNTAAFCVNPWVVNMDLYGRNDIPLGRFLERYCLTTEYKCPAQNCRAQIAQHVRRFVHDGGCVYISLSEMNTDPFSHLSQDNPKQIFMWSKCSKCKSVSAVVPISEETWSLSFAKYLELRFHASVYTRRGAATTTAEGTSNCCQHSLHHDHQQYFSRRNMLACVRYSRVSQWEISLPPPLIDVGHDPRLQANLVEETRLVALKGDEVFSAAKDRIAALQLDEASAADMIKRLAKDQQYFKSKMEELQLKLTSPSLSAEKSSSGSSSSSSKSQDRQVQSIMHRVEDNIVILKRLIAEMVQTWNSRLAEAVVRRKEEKQSSTPVPARKTQPLNLPLDTSDCTTTEDSIAAAAADVSKENQSLDDTSPVSADFNAVDAIAAIQQQEQQLQCSHAIEYETHESVLDTNPEEIVVIQDDRFILKEMTRMDLQIFLDFAPNYFAYMEKCQQTKQPTLLGKIVGIYRVSFKNNTTNAALRTSVLVMENLFYNRSITDKFDLKGSQRNRLVNLDDFDHEGELVLLDENLLNMSCDSPLYIRPHAKAVLNKAIEEDTKFLADNCVMDYSLLVGLEPNSDELVIGIIDYLRTFTWDKKIETMVKKSGILGGQGKLPTIVSPVEYRSRFITAMHKYFLPVPDRWTGLSRGVTVTQ
ncbi:unnamed protein product [Trichogramma brassicae]|uniref:1-phosphatidylinositol-3-phosphate 5-kinase n=1 Tax=Trichogramma brassicae TaxID=86971 RepID=A0A6H5IQQ2_9HYME|nr:unnamed protein product [Trichogramma brassicae]